MSLGPSHPFYAGICKVHKEYFEFFIKNRNKMGDTLLNVGLDNNPAGPGWPWIDWFTKELDIPFKKVYILEIHRPNVEFHTKHFKNQNNVIMIEGDVCKASDYIGEVDTTFWWHGPEHISLDALPDAFNEIDKITKKAILWTCPWGNYYHLGPGVFEADKHHYYPEDENFSQFGLDIFHTCEKNTGDGNIHSYKFKE